MKNKKNIVAKNTTVKFESLPKNYVLQIGQGYQVKFERWLPCVSAKYEAILQELGLAYKVEANERCRFWDAEVYEEDVVTLPVFRQVVSTNDVYICTGQMKVAVPSRKTVAKAAEAKKNVMRKVEQAKSVPTKVDRDYLMKILNGKTAKVAKIKNAEIDKCIGEDIKVLPAVKANGEKTGFYGIFYIQKLQYVPVIKLVVSEQIESIIKGEGGQNVKYWEYILDKEIEVIPV